MEHKDKIEEALFQYFQKRNFAKEFFYHKIDGYLRYNLDTNIYNFYFKDCTYLGKSSQLVKCGLLKEDVDLNKFHWTLPLKTIRKFKIQKIKNEI